MQDARGFITTTVNDDLYRPTQVSVGYGPGGEAAVSHTAYDAVGNPTQVTDPLGRITTTTYDALNRAVGVTFPDGTTASTSYTSTGLKWRMMDELQRVTTTEFDGAGRPVKTVSPALDDGSQAITETIYDAAGNIAATINPRTQRWDMTYDARNRKVREAGPPVMDAVSGQVVRPLTDTAYDGVGNVISVTDPRNCVTTNLYDAANRKTRVTSPAVPVAGQLPGFISPFTTMEYDLAGNVLRVTDGNGHTTINTYDALNRLGTSTDGAGIMVTNVYDAVGNRTAVIDGKQQRTDFTYDGLKRVLTTTDALGKGTTFTYNAVNKATRTDALGLVTTYEYDVRNRLLSTEYAAPHAAEKRVYSYDLAGRLVTVSEPLKGGETNVAYGYDAMNRVTSETTHGLPPNGITHAYGYDLAGNRLRVVYGGTNRTLISTYDALDRLESVSESVGNVAPRLTGYHYDLAGNVVRKALPSSNPVAHPEGDTVETEYDALNRAVTITGTSGTGQPLYHYTQARDRAGNVVALAEQTARLPGRFVSMTYDGVDRLVSENDLTNGQGKVTTYTYDSANNRETRTKQDASGTHTTHYTYDAANRLTGLTEGTWSVAYGYNDAGSRVNRSENGVPNAVYAYDAEQRLVNLSQQGHQYAYTYDYRTRRVQRVEDAQTTKVIFSGGTSVQEMENNAPTVEYVRGSDWGGGVGGILYTLRSGVPSFTHYDGRGDVTSKTDGAGAVTYQASYEAFGTRTQEGGATTDRQKANTKEEDPSGLLNEGMRYRDLESGTFITADPAGFVDGPNLYAYVRQNPWTMFDPEGLNRHEMGVDDAAELGRLIGRVLKGALELLRPIRNAVDSSDPTRQAEGVEGVLNMASGGVPRMAGALADSSGEETRKIVESVKNTLTTPEGWGSIAAGLAVAKFLPEVVGKMETPAVPGSKSAASVAGENEAYVIHGDYIEFDARKARLSSAPSQSSGRGSSLETLATVNKTGQVVVMEGKHRVNLTLEGETFAESVPEKPGWLMYQYQAGLPTPPGVPAGTWAPSLNKTDPLFNPSNPWEGLDGYD